MNYSDTELEQLMADLESDRVERKVSFSGSAPETVRQAVCAFANDLPDHRACGVVFIGVSDEGNPVEIQITDTLLRNIADIKTDGNTLPPPTLTVQTRQLSGHRVIVITVKPSDAPPVRYRGRVYIRIGPRRGVATAQDERILNEKRRSLDLPFDIQPVPSSNIRDINTRYFEDEYLPGAFSSEILEENGRSMAERLASTKMISGIDDHTPTVLGILALGIRPTDFLPGGYVQFLRIDGIDLSDDIIDESTMAGPLAEVVRRAEEKLVSHNRTAVAITTGTTETRTQTYPITALQQILRNAVMHRTYEATNAPIRIYWFNDRIEIISPGGPFGTVTTQNFGQPGITDYRNPNLADALKVLGFVQRFGVGIATARRALERNGNQQMRFEATEGAVLCEIRSSS